MVKISKSEIAKLGLLARIRLPDDAAKTLSSQLTKILDYVAQLQEVDTANLKPTSQVTGLVDVWREDLVTPSEFSRDELLKNAPETKNGYIKVRRVL